MASATGTTGISASVPMPSGMAMVMPNTSSFVPIFTDGVTVMPRVHGPARGTVTGDAFRADMEGATVVIDIQRNGTTVTAIAVATSKNGNVYKEAFVTDCGDGNQTVRAFLIVDGAHLKDG